MWRGDRFDNEDFGGAIVFRECGGAITFWIWECDRFFVVCGDGDRFLGCEMAIVVLGCGKCDRF